jgi:gliding motility-associated-like protein
MFLRNTILLLFGVLIFTCRVSAQIYAPAASDSFAAAYNLPGATDKVFVFNKPEYRVDLIASLKAVSVDRLTGWNFQWSVYDPVNKLYRSLPGSVNGWFSSIDTITISSGYQVLMTKGAISHIFRVWIIINDLNVVITNKDDEDKLLYGYYYCSSLDLHADTTRIPLFYFNPDTKARINVYNSYIIRWTTDNDEATNPSSRLITRVNNPPSDDTWYILTLTDDFNLQRSDSVFYESIQSKANISGTYVNLSNNTEYPDRLYGEYYEDGIKSAPGKYRFDISGSKNMASYEIDFGDGEVLHSWSADTTVRVHEFNSPGMYKVVLTTKSEKPYECPDSANTEAELVYASADNFALPNVFSPNNDGDNDLLSLYENNNIFRSEDVSVSYIDITIFDRTGRKVHTYSGNIRDWKGWDGLIKDSNRQAPEGIYFYVITMFRSWEEKDNPINKNMMKGFFHLYRE